MTCRVENGVTYRQNYNAENRISSIAKINGLCSNPGAEILEVWAFAYDGNGTRVSTAHFTGLNPTPDSISAYFMGGAYEITDGAVRKYYAFAGQTIAMRDGTGLKYFLTDHLGSVAAIMTPNQSGGWDTTQQRYLPFGEVRTDIGSISQTDFGYTSQRKLAEGMGGLMDYRARFYSPALGRFIQPDSIIPNANPQSFNRFSYVINNPLRYTDPTGHVACRTQEECQDMGTTPGGGFSKPKPKPHPGPDYLDPTMLEKTKHGIEVYEFYVSLYNDPDGWWWQTYGADGHFSAMEFIAMMWGYELDVVASDDVYYETIYPDFTEAMARNSREYCEVLGCDISSVTGQFMYLSYYSQSTQQRAKSAIPDMYMLNEKRIKAGSGLAAAIQNPAAFNHSEWNDGFANDQPYSVGNESMFLNPPRYWLHKISGGDPMYVLTGCQYLDAKGATDLFNAYHCTLP